MQIVQVAVVNRRRLFNLIEEVEHVAVNEEQIEEFIEAVNSKLSWMKQLTLHWSVLVSF